MTGPIISKTLLFSAIWVQYAICRQKDVKVTPNLAGSAKIAGFRCDFIKSDTEKVGMAGKAAVFADAIVS
jgi:hypothetical protein